MSKVELKRYRYLVAFDGYNNLYDGDKAVTTYGPFVLASDATAAIEKLEGERDQARADNAWLVDKAVMDARKQRDERIALYQRAVAYLMEGADPVWESVPKDLREILSQALSPADQVKP